MLLNRPLSNLAVLFTGLFLATASLASQVQLEASWSEQLQTDLERLASEINGCGSTLDQLVEDETTEARRESVAQFFGEIHYFQNEFRAIHNRMLVKRENPEAAGEGPRFDAPLNDFQTATDAMNAVVSQLLSELSLKVADLGIALEGDTASLRDMRAVEQALNAVKDEATRLGGVAKAWKDCASNPIPDNPLAPVSVEEFFVVSTGYNYPSDSYYAAAASKAAEQCQLWKSNAAANSDGQVAIAQCGSAVRVSMFDGNVGAKVTGSIRFEFPGINGVRSPQTFKVDFDAGTGYSYPSKSYVEEARTEALEKCQLWVNKITSLKQTGVLLYASCGGFEVVDGIDGNKWVRLQGEVSLSWPETAAEATELTESHTVSTGYSYPSLSYLNEAASNARNACYAWINRMIADSSYTPLLASCEGPTFERSGNVYGKYVGRLFLVPQN